MILEPRISLGKPFNPDVLIEHRLQLMALHEGLESIHPLESAIDANLSCLQGDAWLRVEGGSGQKTLLGLNISCNFL